MKNTFIRLLVSLLSIYMASAYAIKVNTLYETQIPVNTQSDSERIAAIQTAFGNVLSKVSGNASIIDKEPLKSRINSAESLVEEYSYTIASNNANQAHYLLNLRFDPEAINQLLRDTKAPIWGQNRPLILLWVVAELPDQPPEILASDSTNPMIAAFKQAAEQRGLPLLFPMMDITDMNLVSINDINTFTATNLLNAAKRYASDAIIIGRVKFDKSGYKTEWKLFHGNDQWNWIFTDKNLDNIITSMTENITHIVASRYAIVTTNQVQKNISLHITGVSEHTDFAQIIRYLNQLMPVANVSIAKISGNDLTLNVGLRSSDQSFIQALSLSKKLTPVRTSENNPTLAYEWNH